MYNKILIPLDGSATAEKVLPHARWLASKLSIPVELLAVVDIGEISAHMASEKARFLDMLIEEAVSSSTSYLRGIATTFAAAEVSCTVAKGKAADTIIENAASDPTMLISMATHGRSGLNRFLLGSVAEKVLRGASNPMLLIRAASEAAKSVGEAVFKSIIVPLDGSELAARVLPIVAELAHKLDLDVELFRVYHIPFNAYAGDEGFYASHYDALLASARDEAREYLQKQATEVKKLGAPRVVCSTKEGFAADEIIALGRTTADNFIAMSSHGRSGVKRWVLGSVAETVVRHCDDPVLIIRAR